MKDTKLVLAPHVKVWPGEKTGHFAIGSVQTFVSDAEFWRSLLEIAAWWKDPHSENEAFGAFGAQRASAAIAFLRSTRSLVPPLLASGDGRYSRHLLYYSYYTDDVPAAQKRIEASHVIVLGCGGIGNFAGLILAGAGVGRITLVDSDAIELSNLGRQIAFSEGDLGRHKIEVLGDAILARNSSVRVEKIDLDVRGPGDLEHLPSCDLIVLSADHPSQITGWVNTHCVLNRQPYVQIGYVGDIGVYGPFYLPGASGCADCGHLTAFRRPCEREDAWIRRIHIGNKAPSCGPVNALVSGYATADILRFLGGYGSPVAADRRVGIWTTEPRFQFIDCKRSPECPTCGSKAAKEPA